jgi:hypothetical protein
LAKFEGKTKLTDAIKRIRTVQQLSHQQIIVKGGAGRRTLKLSDNKPAMAA